MIPRYQKIIFWTLLAAALVMSIVLIRLRERAHDRLLAAADVMPLNAPAIAPAETVTMLVANDADGSMAPIEQQIALPKDAGDARTHSSATPAGRAMLSRNPLTTFPAAPGLKRCS